MLKHELFRNLLLLLLPCLIVSGGCKNTEQKDTNDNKIIKVSVDKVIEKNIKDVIYITGSIFPNEEVSITNKKAGKITKLYVDMGDSVKAGQILAQIDPTDYNLEYNKTLAQFQGIKTSLEGVDLSGKLAESHSTVRRAKATMDDSYIKMQRLKSLADQKLVPQQDYDSAQAAYLTNKAQYDNAYISVKKLEEDLKALKASKDISAQSVLDTKITAPITSYVQQRNVSLGQYLTSNTELFKLVQTNKLKVKAEIPEKYFNVVKKGQIVKFKLDELNNKYYKAVINRISPAVDMKTRTFEIEALADNINNQLKAGLFVQLTLDLGTSHKGLFVPEKAVYNIVGINKLFTVNNNIVKEHTVELGKHLEGKVEVVNSIKEGEIVADTNVDKLYDEAKVEIVSTGVK